MDHTFEQDGTTYDVVAKVESGGYDWSAEAVFRRQSDGELFYVADQGCSCYSFGDAGLSLQPVRSFDEALRKADDRSALLRSRDLGEVVWE